MKSKRLFAAIGNIDDKFIDEDAEDNILPKGNKNAYKSRFIYRYAGLAACAAVLLFCVWTIPGLFNTPIANTPNNPNGIIEDGNVIIPSEPDEKWQDIPAEPDYGLYIPALQLPEKTDGVEYDMIGLFVYQGKIYTQAGWYYNEDAKYIKENLMGKRLGYATGRINEWSTQDEYAVEFAGSAFGDVYTVNGYDASFRLMIAGTYTEPILTNDGELNITDWVNFYECLNGIGLTYGHDLFGDSFGRLNLRDNWASVKYQEHDNWNNYSEYEYVYHDLTAVSDKDIKVFIDALYLGEFEYVYETSNDFYHSGQEQAHLYFQMNDNTVVQLRLFDGGYVGYQHLGWYFVKIPGEAFDTIFNVCK